MLTALGGLEAVFGAVLGLGGTVSAVLLFMPSEGETMQDFIGILMALAGAGGFFVFFAGYGLVRRRPFGRWLNVTISLGLMAWIILGLWPIEQRDIGDLCLAVPLVVLIAVMFLPSVKSECAGVRRVPDTESKTRQQQPERDR